MTPNFTGEKTARPNNNSVRGFEVVDEIKAAVNSGCYGNMVSCANILAVAACDAVAAVCIYGHWEVHAYPILLGRRDSRIASLNDADNYIPPPTLYFSALLANFQSHGLNIEDLIVLSAGHTAHCTTCRNRIYNETNIDQNYAESLGNICPSSGGDDTTAPLDGTRRRFNKVCLNKLLYSKGLLHSDQQIFKGDGMVRYYSDNQNAFLADFCVSRWGISTLH